jgi:hypothetical protein
MPKPVPDPDRRRILRRTGTATAAGIAAAVLGPASATGSDPAGGSAEKKPQGEQPRGYHETERTRRYYELARF